MMIAGKAFFYMSLSVLFVGLTGCLQLDFFLYGPKRLPADYDFTAALQPFVGNHWEERTIASADGTSVHSVLLFHEARDGTTPAHHGTLVLYCHGNGGNIAYYGARLGWLWQLGYQVWIFDYRGYGKTPGKANENNLLQDATAVYTIAEQHMTVWGKRRVALYGYSLGGAICAALADTVQAPVLITESTFSSVADLIHDAQTFTLSPDWYADTRFDTLMRLSHYQGSTLIMHGTGDTFIQWEYAVRLLRVAQQHERKADAYFAVDGEHRTVPCEHPRMGMTPEGDCKSGVAPAYLNALVRHIDAEILPVENNF
jgi:alpha/beta superfamily hydrolase